MYRGKLFSVHALPNVLGKPRLGLSVSKKVGHAVTRNGVRRRLKEIFHSSGNTLPDDFDLVVSARPAAATASYQELSDEFSRSLSKIGRTRGSGEGG